MSVVWTKGGTLQSGQENFSFPTVMKGGQTLGMWRCETGRWANQVLWKKGLSRARLPCASKSHAPAILCLAGSSECLSLGFLWEKLIEGELRARRQDPQRTGRNHDSHKQGSDGNADSGGFGDPSEKTREGTGDRVREVKCVCRMWQIVAWR